MTLNRKDIPALLPLDIFKPFEYHTHSLSNDTPIYCIEAEEELARISFVFDAGIVTQEQPCLASAVNKLLLSGTAGYTAEGLSSAFDYYGAYLDFDVHQDDAIIQLYCLRKYLDKLLPLIQEVITAALFPEEEIEIYQENSIEQFRISGQKTSFHARRVFMENLFGSAHPYGKRSKESDYSLLNREVILAYYKKHYTNGLKYIISSIQLSKEELNQFEIQFGKLVFSAVKKEIIPVISGGEKDTFIQVDESVQASLRMGFVLFNRRHEDYPKMSVVNTLLGGYFGSRLMKNIREEKGYTYGIGSSLSSLQQAGYFSISADVKNEVQSAAVKEIFEEINRLVTEQTSEDELHTVKNFMLGQFLRSFDGSHSLADRLKLLIDYGFSSDYFQQFTEQIKQTSIADIQLYAEKYFRRENFYTVLAGNKI